jgi:hypothetical protein
LRVQTTWWIVAVVIALGALAEIVGVFWHDVYTPTTVAYVVNDTHDTVTLQGCADTSVSLAPGKRDEINPFQDAGHGYCTVVNGDRDTGARRGCLYMIMSKGRTIKDSTAYVSATRTCES